MKVTSPSRIDIHEQLLEIKEDAGDGLISGRRYNPELAAFISLLIPGLSHLLQLRAYAIGCIFLLLSAVIAFYSDSIVDYLVSNFVIGAVSAVHAYIVATRLNKEIPLI